MNVPVRPFPALQWTTTMFEGSLSRYWSWVHKHVKKIACYLCLLHLYNVPTEVKDQFNWRRSMIVKRELSHASVEPFVWVLAFRAEVVHFIVTSVKGVQELYNVGHFVSVQALEVFRWIPHRWFKKKK